MRRVFSALCALCAICASAQESVEIHPKAIAVLTQQPPVIDGHFDEAEWKDAGVIDAFMQITPVQGAPPTEKTVVHVLVDSENLYIGVQCFDSQPDAILANQMQKEGDINTDDVIQMVIDPFADNRNGYYFALTAGGSKLDGLVDSSKSDIASDWDALWTGKVEINNEGWTAEIAIPFKSISFRNGASEWGFNISRVIRRKQELDRWSGATVNETLLDLIQAGRLGGMVGLKQGLGLTIKPYGAVVVNLDDGKTALRPGFDMSYKLTPSTTALLTINTDFAEAEADQQKVNLSRFPLFFPEKRSFFLQDASVFSFGLLNQSPVPFYSRRIGIVDGEKKDIFAGLKVTGREGAFNFGVLDVQMYDDPDLGRKNLAVARVAANVFDQSTAGVIVTHGDPSTTGDNTLVGGDFKFRSSHVFDERVVQAAAWVMGSLSTAGPANPKVPSGSDKDDIAAGATVQYPNDNIDVYLYAGRYGKEFRPALGFLERPGTWELYSHGRYRFRTPGFIRRIDVRAQNDVYLNLDGSMQTSSGALPSLEIEDEHGDIFYTEHTFVRDVLSEPFAIRENIVIPVGAYGYSRFYAVLALSPKRLLAPGFEFSTGGFFGGTRTDTYGELVVRPSKYFLFAGSYGHIDARLPQGNFIVRLITARANVIFSPEISWNTLAQYDSVSKKAGINSRLRFEISPGQEAFLVLNQGVNISDDFALKAEDGQLSIKLGMTFNF